MTLVMTRCPLPLPGAFAVRRRNLLVPFAAPPNPDSGFRVSSFLFDPNREPILKQALKELLLSGLLMQMPFYISLPLCATDIVLRWVVLFFLTILAALEWRRGGPKKTWGRYL